MGIYNAPSYKVKRNGVWVLVKPEPVEYEHSPKRGIQSGSPMPFILVESVEARKKKF